MNLRHKSCRWFCLAIIVYLSTLPTVSPSKSGKSITTVPEVTGQGPVVLWQYPQDIGTRNLFYGPGGVAGQPRGTLTFVKEDLEGSTPKLDVVDQDGKKWKLKMGIEARPETVASRLVWGVGYFTDENYFVAAARIKELPRMRRGRKYIRPGGTIDNIRLKRTPDDAKKIGIWQWAHDPFSGTRELNGLRVLMALINNWDLKDVNNAILQVRGDEPEQIYLVSDLGASFGSIGLRWLRRSSKGNLNSYEHSKFIKQVTPEDVSFYVPARPAIYHYFTRHEWKMREELRWIGRDIPRGDARWMGDLLGRLSHQQIEDAFRAAQYSDQEVARFSQVVEQRIAELRGL